MGEHFTRSEAWRNATSRRLLRFLRVPEPSGELMHCMLNLDDAAAAPMPKRSVQKNNVTQQMKVGAENWGRARESEAKRQEQTEARHSTAREASKVERAELVE